MAKYDYLKRFNLENNTYDNLTLQDIIENIGYYHMTQHLKMSKNSQRNDEKYENIVRIYSENPYIRKNIIQKLVENGGEMGWKNENVKSKKGRIMEKYVKRRDERMKKRKGC